MKKVSLALCALLLTIGLSSSLVSARSDTQPAIPERDGIYDEPGHPGIKVRVFVHREKPDQVSLSALVCGLEDPESVAAVSPTGWHLPSSWTYNLNPGSVPSSVGAANLATITDNGFDDWAAASGNKVAFTRGADTSVSRSAYDGKMSLLGAGHKALRWE